MYLDLNPENNAIEKVALFESMLKGKTFTFFDADDFELIIDYYFKVNFIEKANKALEIALEQYPDDLSLLLLKVDILNSRQSFKKSLKILLKLNRIYPNNIDVIFALGKIYSILESTKLAILFLNKYMSLLN